MEALKGVGRIISTLLVVLAVVLAVALVGVRLVGFEVFTVLSGSMEPTYKTGSLIWVQEREPSEVEVGDAITFVMNEDLDVATHRVIEIDAENSHFYTQGDANDAPDGSPVHFNNLIGVPVFTVPYLGYLVSYIQQPPGCYVALIVAAAVLALMIIPDLFDRADARAAGRGAEGDSGRGVSVPRGTGPQPGRGDPARTRADSLTPEQRAYYAQRELERRRAERARSNDPRQRMQTQAGLAPSPTAERQAPRPRRDARPAAPNPGIPQGSHSMADTRRDERR